MSSKQPGWLPVVGGPRDGQEVYLSTEPQPDIIVFLNCDDERNGVGFYAYALDCKSIVWFDA